MRGRFRTGTAAIGLAALLVTACGSLGGGSGSGAGSTAGSPGGEVKVGLSSILSGPAASAGTGTDAGVMAYLKAVNDKGGINGYKFTFEEQDNKYDPAQSAIVARDMVSKGVFTIVTEGTANLAATVPITDPAGIPVMTESDGGAVTPPGKFAHAYGVNPDYAAMATLGAKFILDKLNQKKVSFIYVNTATGAPAKEAFPAYFTKHGGQVLDTEAVPQATTDWTPFAQKLKASGATTVYSFILDSQMAGLQKAADAIGYKPTWVCWFYVYTPAYLKLAGPLATGVYTSQFTIPLDKTSDPAVKEFQTAMQKYAPPSELDSPVAAQGWTLGAIIAYGVRQATAGGKKLTAQNYERALSNVNSVQIGLVPAITYNADTHAGASKAGWFKIDNGKLVEYSPFEDLPKPGA